MLKFLTLKLKQRYEGFEHNRERQTQANKADPICTGHRVEKANEGFHD
jgi:hypothetical protein